MNNTFDLGDVPDKDDIETARELIEKIETLADDLPEEAEDFGPSVIETAGDIANYIDEHDQVTKKQLTALENMLDGLRRWFLD